MAEAIHLHFDKAVVKTQQLHQSPHQLSLTCTRQTPQANDDWTLNQLWQQIPGPHGVDDAIDQGVEPK